MQLLTSEQLASLCRSLRESAGLDQGQLAQRLGVHVKTITAAEDAGQPSRVGIRIQIIRELAGRTVEKVIRYQIT